MTNFVIFGASGDLAKNYLYPSLFHLWQRGTVFNYFGFGRSPLSDADLQAIIEQSTKSADFSKLHRYVSGGYDVNGLKALSQVIGPTESTIFYLSLPIRPDILKPLLDGLIQNHLINKDSRIVIEKPFGTDYHSAKVLMDLLTDTVGSDIVFLVDHYLTKELVRNLITLRFANPIFDHLWDCRYIKEINITVIEEKGIDDRGQYYDQTGTIRDMIQNHCLQLLALATMDRPNSLEYSDFTAQKIAVLKNLRLFGPWKNNVKIGQYEGYLKEKDVAPTSTTETMAHIKFRLDVPKWRGVPLNITNGKKLGQKLTEINIVFHQDVDNLWGEDHTSFTPNQLTINLHPDNDIILTINSTFNPHKALPKPINLRLGPLDPTSVAVSPYENVISDIVDNNRLNSPSFEEILVQWRIVDKILAIPDLRSTLFCY
jgi:glucose-6-phosphate 1-dehydrogenase